MHFLCQFVLVIVKLFDLSQDSQVMMLVVLTRQLARNLVLNVLNKILVDDSSHNTTPTTIETRFYIFKNLGFALAKIIRKAVVLDASRISKDILADWPNLLQNQCGKNL